jgi:hypothetical protein
MTRSIAVAVTLLLCACINPQPPPPPPDLAPRAVVVPPPPPPPPPPTAAEVEITGTVVRPKGVKGEVKVWAMNSPCFQPGAAAYGEARANPDRFFLEVFVPQGTPIWMCAALSDGKDAFKLWGQAERAPVIGKGTGEVVFGEQTIALKKGPLVTAPRMLTH